MLLNLRWKPFSQNIWMRVLRIDRFKPTCSFIKFSEFDFLRGKERISYETDKVYKSMRCLWMTTTQNPTNRTGEYWKITLKLESFYSSLYRVFLRVSPTRLNTKKMMNIYQVKANANWWVSDPRLSIIFYVLLFVFVESIDPS